MISDPLSSSSETSQSQILQRLGLGSYKHRAVGPTVFNEIVLMALQNKFGVLEATGGDMASAQAMADAYRSAVQADERILHQTTRLLLRIGYRGGGRGGHNSNSRSRSDNDNEREVYFGDVRQPDGAIHNISAMYVQRVLQESPLTQLCQEFPYALELIPVLHNPEVHGGGGVSHHTNQGANVDAQWIIHDALRDSFRGLEDWCSGYQDSQHIGGYGVVSNGLALPSSHPLHLDVEILFNAVERATASQGRSIFNHHFQFVQLPVNLLEGMDVAHDIRERGYKVYGMRPLKAYQWQQQAPPQQIGRGGGGGEWPPVLLADYELMIKTKDNSGNASDDGRAVWTNDNLTDLPKSYGAALKTVLSHLDGNDDDDDDTTAPDADTITACRLLQSTLQDLDATTFATLDEHYTYIAQHVVPALSQIVAYDETTSMYLEQFFHEHTNLVKYQVAQTTRQFLQPTYPDLSSSNKNNVRLQEYALQKALSSTDVTIVNCSSVAQLRDIIKVARKLDDDAQHQQGTAESSSVAAARAALSSSSPTTFNLL